MKRTEIAEAIGTTTESVRRWHKAAEVAGMMPSAPVVGTESEGDAATAVSSPALTAAIKASPSVDIASTKAFNARQLENPYSLATTSCARVT
jgi:hypothetical protein